MKYIRKFETINQPKIGDYVYCEEQPILIDKFGFNDAVEFINSNIGKIEKINRYLDEYVVRFENVPLKLKAFFINCKDNKCRTFNLEHIKFFSPNKEECEKFIEPYLASRKFNL